MKIRIELGRISDKGAQKCLSGGLAAGMLACKLEEARRASGRSFPFHDVWSALREAEDQAKALRKAFHRSPEAKELRDTLRGWNKQFKKEARKDVLVQTPPVGEARIGALKGLLGQAVRHGAQVCGRAPIPYAVERHLEDWAMKTGREIEEIPLKKVPANAKKVAGSGNSMRRR